MFISDCKGLLVAELSVNFWDYSFSDHPLIIFDFLSSDQPTKKCSYGTQNNCSAIKKKKKKKKLPWKGTYIFFIDDKIIYLLTYT